VDFDPGHVVYVWLDALTNYITFCGYNPDGESDEHYKKFWPADLHLIGKDIIRFHTIYWPIFLMALGEPLPKQVFGHPWLLVSSSDSATGEKMSKSLGNVIYADDLVDYFGVDAVRYFVLHEMPFANDGALSYSLLIERINADLANILGNLVNRTIAMDHKYFGGKIMAPDTAEEIDEELRSVALAMPGRVAKQMEGLHVADAIDEIFVLLRRANKYIDETTPWVLARDPEKASRLGTVLYNLLESIRFAAVALEAFLPGTAEKILHQLNVENCGLASLNSFDGMPVGGQVGVAEILFERMDPAKKLQEIADAKAAKEVPQSTVTFKPEIAFDTFEQVDMTVVKVVSCENVPKSKKLLKFQLDDGSGKPRQILSGIAAYYQADELVGKTLVACTNLAPRKMMGLESCGMLLSAEKDGKLELLMLSDTIPAGAKLC
ncbi:MAG: methionine--tRNA ligase subunit beta, partial [Clostridia bacterium]|nr:methionine--tRNA ligase subunit beta [Clostridia bacterium]